jgi:hypothetical protein
VREQVSLQLCVESQIHLLQGEALVNPTASTSNSYLPRWQ